jgi:hypothetical protein
MVATQLLNSKKVIYISENPFEAHKAMFTMRDAVIRAAGFEWPHLFASCFALMPNDGDILDK